LKETHSLLKLKLQEKYSIYLSGEEFKMLILVYPFLYLLRSADFLYHQLWTEDFRRFYNFDIKALKKACLALLPEPEILTEDFFTHFKEIIKENQELKVKINDLLYDVADTSRGISQDQMDRLNFIESQILT